MASTYPIGTIGSVASLLAATLYQGNPDRNHKVWNVVMFKIIAFYTKTLLAWLYARIGNLLTHGRHLYDRITSLSGEDWVHDVRSESKD
jgi:hypothetical protein